jgi:hypothetical protein
VDGGSRAGTRPARARPLSLLHRRSGPAITRWRRST